MKKKILIIVMSFCMLLTCMPQTTGIAFAESERSQELSATEQTPKRCDYTQAVGEQTSHRIIQTRDELKEGTSSENGISLFSNEEDSSAQKIRYGKQYLLDHNADKSKDVILTLYDRIEAGFRASNEIIDLVFDEDEFDAAEEDVAVAYNLVKEDYPEYFWLGNAWWNYMYSYEDDPDTNYVEAMEPEYLFDDGEALANAQAEFNCEVEKLLAQADAMATDYEKELWLHDYLAKTNEYISYSKCAHTAYGALVDGEAVCEGYTRAFQLLLNKLDIENCTVTGSSDLSDEAEVDHIWNAVQLDGQWYQVDITWDDTDNVLEDVYHAYFNLTTQDMEKDHQIMGNYFDIPECTDSKYFYFNQNSRFVFMEEGETFDNEKFVTTAAEQIANRGYAEVYSPGNSEEELWKHCEANAAQIAAKLGMESYCISGLPNGYTEYHLYISEEEEATSPFFGRIILGKKDLSDVKIRLYGNDEQLKAEGESRLDIIENAIMQHRKDDKLHIVAAKKYITDADTDWWDMEDSGTWYTGFYFDDLPDGEYNLAVYKEGYGLWVYPIEIGKNGTSFEEADDDIKCWWPIYNLGDIDDNTWIDSSDAIFMQRYISNWDDYIKNGNRYAADINNDGKVNIKDLTILQRHLAGWTEYKNLEDYENGTKEITDVGDAA